MNDWRSLSDSFLRHDHGGGECPLVRLISRILVAYFAATIFAGFWVSKRGSKDLDSYFLGGKSLPWNLLGISDASGMFDISGTMLMVYWLFAYGLKSIWLPFMWPVFNQIFLMMFLSAWLRRSNVLTGAEWIQFRFGRGTGANLAHLSVVFFAIVNTIGMLAFAFKGIGKFAVTMLPWQLSTQTEGLLSNENLYAILILLAHQRLRDQGRHGQRRDHRGDAVHDPHHHLDPHRRDRDLQSLARGRITARCPTAGSIRSSAGSWTSIGPASSTR